MNNKQRKLQKNMLSSFKFRLFLIFKVPLAYLAGIKLLRLDTEACTVGIKYKHINTNPFKSMYFGAQAMAAEMSTGALAMFTTEGFDESIAMLVVGMDCTFSKKAIGKIRFECKDGELFQEQIKKCVELNEPVKLISKSIGYNEENEIVSEFNLTWSFKVRSKKS